MSKDNGVTYEMVRDAAIAFTARFGRKPRNREVQQMLGGAGHLISAYMNTWRRDGIESD